LLERQKLMIFWLEGSCRSEVLGGTFFTRSPSSRRHDFGTSTTASSLGRVFLVLAISVLDEDPKRPER